MRDRGVAAEAVAELAAEVGGPVAELVRVPVEEH